MRSNARRHVGTGILLASTVLPILIMMPSTSSAAEETGIRSGDSEARVVAVLGDPTGRVIRGRVELLYNPRGLVELREGKVTVGELLRAEEQRLAASDPGPRPRVSRQKMRKMQRAGKWKW